MGFFSILWALTSGKVSEVEFSLEIDTNDKAEPKKDVYIEGEELIISREKLDILIASIKRDTMRKVISIKTE